MAFTTLCKLADLLEGESAAFALEGREVLLLWPYDGALKAFQGTCPHQEISLADALFDGRILMCQAHRWAFDGCNGRGIAPHFCQLAQYALRIENGMAQVDVACVVAAEA
jgi:toluene monooxygenase system ferredoxin subunit